MSRAPLTVVALGGNALLRRGQPLTADNQAQAARHAAHLLAEVSGEHRLVVTHGNGPQVGLLALLSENYTDVEPYPLDVLDAESEGQIGYVLEVELDNAIHDQHTVAIITRTLVDADDPAFQNPSKPIGPVYDEETAKALAAARGWTVKPDGEHFRRVVASPDPKRIVELPAIRHLVDAGFLVVCAGGGGVPVVDDGNGGQRGVEAVIDKDLASALLAADLGADHLVLATDVDSVRQDFGTPAERRIAEATPAGLRSLELAAGSMGPKAEACARFVEATGGTAAIGSLEQLPEILAGRAGTLVRRDGADLTYHDAMEAVA
jgi:carbamate kinase